MISSSCSFGDPFLNSEETDFGFRPLDLLPRIDCIVRHSSKIRLGMFLGMPLQLGVSAPLQVRVCLVKVLPRSACGRTPCSGAWPLWPLSLLGACDRDPRCPRAFGAGGGTGLCAGGRLQVTQSVSCPTGAGLIVDFDLGVSGCIGPCATHSSRHLNPFLFVYLPCCGFPRWIHAGSGAGVSPGLPIVHCPGHDGRSSINTSPMRRDSGAPHPHPLAREPSPWG